MRTETTAHKPEEEEADVAVLMHGFLASLTTKLSTVYEAMGIEPYDTESSQEFEAVSFNALPEEGRLSAFATHVGYLRASHSVQSEIGEPGTYIVDGVIETEHNPKLKPFQARGRMSLPGTNEEVYRTEPVAFKSVNEITSLITNATYEPNTPEDADEQTIAITKAFHRSLRRIRSGYGNFLDNASTISKHGFAPFEVRWQQRGGQWSLFDVAFREQATLERWLFDDRQSFLEAAEFQTGGINFNNYVLPHGDTPETARLLVLNLHATGNNVEGVSPIRVITGLRKLKELLLQCSGVAFQKYGVPIPIVLDEMSETGGTVVSRMGEGDHKAELQKLVTRIRAMRSRLGDPLVMPPGKKLEYVTPTNDMPDVTPMLHYIDTMTALVFHNEGALLGSQSFGSYASASVADSKFMRAAPTYARRISVGLTQLLHLALKWNHPKFDEIDELPEYTFRFTGTQDTGAWVQDMVQVMNSHPWNWPDEPRKTVAQRMGLKRDGFDDEPVKGVPLDGDAEMPIADAGGADVQKSALNGAQVTSMVEVLAQVASGQLPAESAIRILMRAFQMSRAEASAMVNPAQGFEQAEQKPPAVEGVTDGN